MPKNILPKLLLVTAISPYPQNSGGATRMYYTIKELSKYFSIYLITFHPQEYVLEKNELNFYKKYTTWYTIFDLAVKSETSFVTDGIPYWFSDWNNEELKLFLSQFVQENNIKFVQIEFTQLLYLIDYLPSNIITSFISHDISTISFKRRLSEVKQLHRMLVHYMRWLQIDLYEKKYISKYHLISTVSETDKLTAQKIFNLKKINVVSNGMENIQIKPNKIGSVIRLGYIGSFSHSPNKYAFEYFINQIIPELKNKGIDYKFVLAGNNDPIVVNTIVNKTTPDIQKKIINMGFVEKVDSFYSSIDCLIAPISSGSGSRIKIIEALSFGIPVISSTIGAEGINIDSNYLKIVNQPQDYVIEIGEIYKLSSSDFSLLQNQLTPFLWSNIFKKYAKILLETFFLNKKSLNISINNEI